MNRQNIGQSNEKKCETRSKGSLSRERFGEIMKAMIDVHAHVLPGLDDGARQMEESVQMLRKLASMGFAGVIATPHYSRRRELYGMEQLILELQQRVREYLPDFFIYPGQETYYHDELTDRLRQGKAFTMAGSRYVLVEFDPNVSYSMMYQGIRKLSGAGYDPILAHIERYGCLRKENHLQELVSAKCLLQMNYESLQGKWFDREVRWCRKQVEAGTIDLLGSDMHRMDYRPPEFGEALKWLEQHISPEYLDQLTRRNPLRIIDQGKQQSSEKNKS